jgi:hypothetical protein
MNRAGRTMLVKPLFYEALSGEFYSSTDELNGPHTLGKLAVAAFKKGKEVMVADDASRFEYRPSWASNVLVDASFGNVGNLCILHELDLATSARRISFLNHPTPPSGEFMTVLTGGGNNTNFDLELNEELAIAGSFVTSMAIDFFQQISDS